MSRKEQIELIQDTCDDLDNLIAKLYRLDPKLFRSEIDQLFDIVANLEDKIAETFSH